MSELKLRPPSFVAERDDGVHASGAARRDEARQQSDKRQQASDAGKGERVGGADTEKQGSQEARESERGENADGHAQERKACPLCKHEAQNIAALSAESDANAEFLGPLGDAVSDQAIDDDGGQHT